MAAGEGYLFESDDFPDLTFRIRYNEVVRLYFNNNTNETFVIFDDEGGTVVHMLPPGTQRRFAFAPNRMPSYYKLQRIQGGQLLEPDSYLLFRRRVD